MQAPEYIALSYTWGKAEWDPFISNELSDERTVAILVNGLRMMITENLRDYLQETRTHGWVWLWIDAVSINQADKKELASQVSRMGDIYKNAAAVDVWLGNDDESSDKVIAIIEKLATVEQNAALEVTKSFTSAFDENVLSRFGLTDLIHPRSYRDWDAFYRFYRRRWFQRAWVVQVLALTEYIRFRWGSKVLTFPTLGLSAARLREGGFDSGLLAGAMIRYKEEGRKFSFSPTRLGEILTCIRFLQQACKGEPFDGADPRTLERLGSDVGQNWYGILLLVWTMTSTFECRDPRDKLFSLIGITSTIAEPCEADSSPMTVDYTKSVAETFEDTTRNIMNAGAALNILSFLMAPMENHQKKNLF